jgi:hypothetical protein
MIQETVFVASFSLFVVAQIVCEVYLSRIVPKKSTNLRMRFWARAAADVSAAILVGIVCYSVVSVMAKSGWKKTAWGLALVPGAAVVSCAILLQGTNTVLDKSGGVGCFGVTRAALAAAKRKGRGTKIYRKETK